MSNATVQPQERLRDLLTQANELHAKGVRSADEDKQLETVMTEAHAMRAQIDRNKDFLALQDWAKGSAGMLTLADGTRTGVSIKPDGGALVEPQFATRAQAEEASDRMDSLMRAYEEGRYDPGTRAITDTKEYRAALRSYLRTGAGGYRSPSDQAIRTLQEGADPSGGLAV